jgi:hypothetical protein
MNVRLAMSELSVIEKLVLEEIGGKNLAIHAYDKMMWNESCSSGRFQQT